MDTLKFAAPVKRSASGPASFTLACPQLFDTESGFTRALATRDSDMEPHAIYARGPVADLCTSHNRRLALTSQRTKLVDAEPNTDEEAASILASIESIDTELASLPKSRATPTYHVARTLQVFADTDESSD